MKHIHYQKLKGWKYRLVRNFIINIGIKGFDIKTEYIELAESGLLFIRKGYAWDGASGPTVDTRNSMRGSLVHDALYQLIRLGKLDRKHKAVADELLLNLCRQDGMSRARSWIWYQAVKRFGLVGLLQNHRGDYLTAP